MGTQEIQGLAPRSFAGTRKMRSNVVLEDEQLRTLLQMFVEISLSRTLTKSEGHVQTALKKALEKSLSEW